MRVIYEEREETSAFENKHNTQRVNLNDVLQFCSAVAVK